MSRVLVIGIGSLIMTDDGIGARVAGAIGGKLQKNDMTVLIGETDVQYCLDEIRPDDFLVVIDSMMQGGEPGNIEIAPLMDVAKSRGKLRSQHDYSLIDAVSLTYPNMRGYLIGIEAAEIRFGFDLSGPLEERFNTICERVFNTITELRGETNLA
jgi:hydrogenase maturation protease